MSIEVILKEHVEHLGRRGEIVKVASGYARNFLFPRKLAMAVTSENKKQIERERVKDEAREADEVKARQGAGRPRSRPGHRHRPSRGRERHAVRIGDDGRHRGCPCGPRRDGGSAQDPAGRTAEGARRPRGPVKFHREVTAKLKVRIVPAT